MTTRTIFADADTATTTLARLLGLFEEAPQGEVPESLRGQMDDACWRDCASRLKIVFTPLDGGVDCEIRGTAPTGVTRGGPGGRRILSPRWSFVFAPTQGPTWLRQIGGVGHDPRGLVVQALVSAALAGQEAQSTAVRERCLRQAQDAPRLAKEATDRRAARARQERDEAAARWYTS